MTTSRARSSAPRGPGTLVVVGTPLGNLGDLSPRAAEALASADVIACEDTRRTGRLLAHLGIERSPMVVLNEHTERQAVAGILTRIRGGDTVALVSDAGMPVLSDPGGPLVAAVAGAGLPLTVVPGPDAAVTALAVAGLGSGRFVFEGFLPRKGRARTDALAALRSEERTVVLYEAPHRIAALVGDMIDALGPERQAAICRELTKVHEEIVRGSLLELAAAPCVVNPRGEYVVVLAGAAPPQSATDGELLAALGRSLAGGSTRRDAVDAVVAETGASHRRVYDLAIGLEP